jgi:hypothetical protein
MMEQLKKYIHDRTYLKYFFGKNCLKNDIYIFFFIYTSLICLSTASCDFSLTLPIYTTVKIEKAFLTLLRQRVRDVEEVLEEVHECGSSGQSKLCSA